MLTIASSVSLGACTTSRATSVGVTSTEPVSSRVRCVSEPASKTAGSLVIELLPATPCDREHSGTLRVTNSGSTTCTSDVLATIDRAPMWFVSQSGYGGARGTWQPMPTNATEAVGVNEYPPGVRSWTVVLPSVQTDRSVWSFTPSLGCEGVAVDADIAFSTRTLASLRP